MGGIAVMLSNKTTHREQNPWFILQETFPASYQNYVFDLNTVMIAMTEFLFSRFLFTG